MLYLGHFSFDELDSDQKVRHGYFTCIVESTTADNAVDEFKAHILALKKSDDIFAGIKKIYIEDIVEIQKIPEKTIVTRFQSSVGEFPKSISYSLPSVNTPGVDTFGLAQEVTKNDVHTEDYVKSIPFLQFE